MLGYCMLLTAGVFATALPSALIPDSLLSLHQLVNTPPLRLLRIQLRRWLPWMLSLLAPALVVAFYDPGNISSRLGEKTLLLVCNLVGMAALGVYSFCYYFSMGSVAQHWQEGTAGRWYDRMLEFNPMLRVPLPRGLVPALTATARVFSLGIVLVVTQLYVARTWGAIHMVWPTAIAAVWTFYRLYKLAPRFDAAYYPTNGFYREIFQRGNRRSARQEPVSYEAVYWVPHRWRSHTWISLLQMDRVMPIGRFLTVGMVILWIMVWRSAEPLYITVYLCLLVAGKNLTVLTLSRQDLLPSAFRSQYSPAFDWSIAHFFVNLRWTPPIFLGLMALGWLHPGFSMQSAGLWTLLDIILSFGFAACSAFLAPQQRRERVHG